jgi:hypothetical protein
MNKRRRQPFPQIYIYFISAFLVLTISIVISSLLAISGIVEYSKIPYNYYLIGSIFLSFVLFKVKFRKLRHFKIYLLRNFVRFNTLFKKVDNKMYLKEVIILTSMQEKSINLWKACLSDRKAVLLAAIKTSQRQIETENLLISLSPFSPAESIMTIFDVSDNRRCLYEVHIPDRYLDDICISFDSEIQKRIVNIENNKRKAIDDDLDSLLVKQMKKSLV